jgi:hypothetical protein
VVRTQRGPKQSACGGYLKARVAIGVGFTARKARRGGDFTAVLVQLRRERVAKSKAHGAKFIIISVANANIRQMSRQPNQAKIQNRSTANFDRQRESFSAGASKKNEPQKKPALI